MEIKEEYDVLRLIEHNQVCYISSEYVKGKTLVRWIKYHPCVKKEELFHIIGGIAGQLSQIHRCRGNPCYRYVNPYSIIISEDSKVFFLDINAGSNAGQLRLMKRRTVREHFLPPDEPYYQKESVGLDIYGFGRTVQYLLSESDVEPYLTRKEESKLKKIISRCLDRNSKKSFQNVSEIQKIIPKNIQSKKDKQIQTEPTIRFAITVLGLCMIAGLAAGGGYMAVHSICSVSEEQKSEKQKKNQEGGQAGNRTEGKVMAAEDRENQEMKKESQLSMELGLVHFLKFKDYKKSREYFKEAGEYALAEHMEVIAETLSGEGNRSFPERLRDALSGAEAEIQKVNGEKIGEKPDYYRCMIRGYISLGEEKDLREVLRLGKECIRETAGDDLSEVLGYLAFAHEGLGEFDEAADMYGEQMEYEEDEKAREEIYKKTAHLLELSGKSSEAQELLRKGIGEIEGSIELRTLYIGTLLKDGGIDRELCIQSIRSQLKESPELSEHEEFQKLMREHGINLEGENIWQAK